MQIKLFTLSIQSTSYLLLESLTNIVNKIVHSIDLIYILLTPWVRIVKIFEGNAEKIVKNRHEIFINSYKSNDNNFYSCVHLLEQAATTRKIRKRAGQLGVTQFRITDIYRSQQGCTLARCTDWTLGKTLRSTWLRSSNKNRNGGNIFKSIFRILKCNWGFQVIRFSTLLTSRNIDYNIGCENKFLSFFPIVKFFYLSFLRVLSNASFFHSNLKWFWQTVLRI